MENGEFLVMLLQILAKTRTYVSVFSIMFSSWQV